MKQDFLTLNNFSSEEIKAFLEKTAKLKASKDKLTDQLKNKSVALLFQKPSNRTRVSFEIGIWQLGGKCLYLSPREIKLGERESVADVARTLTRYLSCLVARTFTHQDMIDLAQYADIPVINGLSDLYHPCQSLADLFSIKEKFGKLRGLNCAYIGDGNNVCHSLLIGAAKVGMNVNVATPKGYEPNAGVIKSANTVAMETSAKIYISNSTKEAVAGAQVIYADVWTSMGQEEEEKKRKNDFKDFQVNAALCKNADKDFIFMHCLPAHRGEEVTDEVIDGNHSIVFDQAENRMHAQKSILIKLLGES